MEPAQQTITTIKIENKIVDMFAPDGQTRFFGYERWLCFYGIKIKGLA
jgi:hypothetical protein